MPAPSPAEIIAAGHETYVGCDACRLLVDANLAMGKLAETDKAHVPINRLRFRCSRCGGLGEPLVKGAGNELIGRPTIWPVERQDPICERCGKPIAGKSHTACLRAWNGDWAASYWRRYFPDDAGTDRPAAT